jgi:uncharacterized ion transporter superfamily protein YfcC
MFYAWQLTKTPETSNSKQNTKTIKKAKSKNKEKEKDADYFCTKRIIAVIIIKVSNKLLKRSDSWKQ